jgi:2-polyprenyl-3-methyl-5-hydroxy-6-metoxy-1,4-benzoquinol methylase
VKEAMRPSAAGFCADRRPCPECGGRDHLRLRARFPEAEIVECRRCGIAFTQPEEAVGCAGYEVDAALSEGYAGEEARFRGIARRRIRFIRRFLLQGGLLDVGCSVGYLVEEAARVGFDAVGVDTDAAAVRMGREKGRNVRAGTVESAVSERVNVVTLQHILEHVGEPGDLLAAVKRQLLPRGFLFLWVPNCAGLAPRIAPRWWYGWQPRQHYRHYTPRALRRLVERAGFQVVQVRTQSMEHRLALQSRWRETLKRACVWLLAKAGLCLGRGDEIALVARLPEMDG